MGKAGGNNHGGTRPKPLAVKLAQGTVRADRMPQNAPTGDLATVDKLPAPPAWLNMRQAEYFRQVAVLCSRMKVLAFEDTLMLMLVACRLEEFERLQEDIEHEGNTYQIVDKAGNTLMKANPKVAMKNDAMRHAQSLLCEFGLSPSARSKVSMQKEGETNPFESLEREERTRREIDG